MFCKTFFNRLSVGSKTSHIRGQFRAVAQIASAIDIPKVKAFGERMNIPYELSFVIFNKSNTQYLGNLSTEELYERISFAEEKLSFSTSEILENLEFLNKPHYVSLSTELMLQRQGYKLAVRREAERTRLKVAVPLTNKLSYVELLSCILGVPMKSIYLKAAIHGDWTLWLLSLLNRFDSLVKVSEYLKGDRVLDLTLANPSHFRPLPEIQENIDLIEKLLKKGHLSPKHSLFFYPGIPAFAQHKIAFLPHLMKYLTITRVADLPKIIKDRIETFAAEYDIEAELVLEKAKEHFCTAWAVLSCRRFDAFAVMVQEVIVEKEELLLPHINKLARRKAKNVKDAIEAVKTQQLSNSAIQHFSAYHWTLVWQQLHGSNPASEPIYLLLLNKGFSHEVLTPYRTKIIPSVNVSDFNKVLAWDEFIDLDMDNSDKAMQIKFLNLLLYHALKLK